MRKKSLKKDRSFVWTTLLVVALAAFLAISMLLNLRALASGAGAAGSSAVTIRPYIGSLKNISYGYLDSPNGKLLGVVPIVSINSIEVNTSRDVVDAGKDPGFYINAVYSGDFAFGTDNVTKYLQDTVSFYYIGFYSGNGTMYTVGSGNAGRYFIENGTQSIYTPNGQSNLHYMAIRVHVMATPNASGVWNFCAGFFGSYKNNSEWGRVFNNFSESRDNFTNVSMVNLVSGNCREVEVK